MCTRSTCILTYIHKYNQDIFNGNYAPFRVINPSDITSSAIITNPSMEGSIIEDCIIYDEENLLVLLKKINNNVNYYKHYFHFLWFLNLDI